MVWSIWGCSLFVVSASGVAGLAEDGEWSGFAAVSAWGGVVGCEFVGWGCWVWGALVAGAGVAVLLGPLLDELFAALVFVVGGWWWFGWGGLVVFGWFVGHVGFLGCCGFVVGCAVWGGW